MKSVSLQFPGPIERRGDPVVAMLCRICAKSNSYAVPIYDDFGMLFGLPNKINKYLPIKVSESDRLPLTVCRDCVTTICHFDDMYRYSLEAQKRLTNLLGIEGGLEIKTELEDTVQIKEEPEIIEFLEDETTLMDSADVADFNIVEADCKTEAEDSSVNNKTYSSNHAGKRSEPSNSNSDVLELVECASCKLMFVEEDVLAHAEICEGKDKFPEKFSNRRRHTSKESVNTKFLMKALGVKKPKAPPKEIFGKYTVIGDKYVCSLCHKEFSDGFFFNSHVRKECPFHHFDCDQCESTFKRKRSLTTHRLVVHRPEEEHICDICGKIMFRRRSFELHIQYHFSERIFQCDQCTKNYKRKAALQRHQRVTHALPIINAKNTRFVCGFCSAQFSNESRLRIHQRKHEGVRPFVCEKCGRRFFAESGLKQHQSRITCLEIEQTVGKKLYKYVHEVSL